MKNVMLTSLLMAAVLSCVIVNSLEAKEKPRIAVMDFENKAGGWGGYRLGTQAADMLTTKLVQTKKFTVYEREKLDNLMREQNLGASGRVTPQTAAKIGKLIGVQYIVTGAVTEFGRSDSGAHGHGFGVRKNTYSGTVDVRVVSAETGEILMANTSSSEAANVSVSVMGLGGGKDYDEKLAHEVLREAINKVAEDIENQVGELKGDSSASSSSAFEAKVAKADGGKIWINAGTNKGIAVGDHFTVYHKGEEIVDPDTGVALGAEEKPIGRLTITSVEEKYAIGEMDGKGEATTGDIVR